MFVCCIPCALGLHTARFGMMRDGMARPCGSRTRVTWVLGYSVLSLFLFSVCFQAGATSMWASCCGLLNEVMGTGAVRGQQAGFAGGAGPFRFAPNAAFSSCPSPAAAAANVVCKACGLPFSVFRKKVSRFLLNHIFTNMN